MRPDKPIPYRDCSYECHVLTVTVFFFAAIFANEINISVFLFVLLLLSINFFSTIYIVSLTKMSSYIHFLKQLKRNWCFIFLNLHIFLFTCTVVDILLLEIVNTQIFIAYFRVSVINS